MRVYGSEKDIWYKGEANPDYKLVVINSSNKGFTSQMGTDSGSYMIKKFTQKMQDNINNKNRLFLFEISHQIQDELHSDGKQLIEAKFNNKLEYVKFTKFKEKRKMSPDKIVMIAMAH